MNLFSMFKRSTPVEQRATFAPADMLPFSGFHMFGFGGTTADVGVEVTPDTALAASSVFSGVSIIASTIAGLPLHVHDRESGGKVYDHPVSRLIRDPNPYMTPFTLWETLVVDILTRGNLYGYVERVDGEPVSIYPLPAASTAPKRQAGELLYGVGGLSNGYALRPDEVLHVPHMPIHGVVGRSPLMIARQSIGLSLALEKFVGKFFANGCHMPGILELPAMSKDAREQFVQQLKEYHTGVENAHRQMIPAVPGVKYHSTSADAEKAQMMEARVHQVREVARILRIPPHMLADLEKSSYASIEQQGLEFSQYTIAPWTLRIEQELNRKLLRSDEQDRYVLRFNLDALLRATTRERYAAHSMAVGGPFMSVNEARRLEGLQPVKGGDEVLSPLNSAPASSRAVFGVVEDAAQRLIVKERNAVLRASKKHQDDPEGFRGWVDAFYRDHEQLVTRAYKPAASLLATDTDDMASQYCEEQRAALLEAINAGSVDDLLTRWESDRAGEVAEKVMNSVEI